MQRAADFFRVGLAWLMRGTRCTCTLGGRSCMLTRTTCAQTQTDTNTQTDTHRHTETQRHTQAHSIAITHAHSIAITATVSEANI